MTRLPMDTFANHQTGQVEGQTAISVAGLTDYLKALTEENPVLQRLWVIGEVSSTNRHASGLFFTLKDIETDDSLNCVAWRSQLPKLASVPKVGEQVTLLGSLRLYPQRSYYQLMVWQVLPTGDGLRALRYRQLKQRLAAEGLFDAEQKQPLPPYPTCLAIITSPQAAAWGDIQRTLRQHHPGLPILFSPATVQGDFAPRSIEQAIQRVVEDGRADVLILARGGGAVEDLDCFNDERVVRAVACCPIPVVTGIGHERDESLADLAADVCAHTPTAAAVAAVPSLESLEIAHQERLTWLTTAMVEILARQTSALTLLRQRLHRLRLDRQLHQEQAHLHQLKQRLIQSVQVELRQATQRCESLREQLATLDPEAVLRRGYALVRQSQGELITDADQVAVGDSLEIQLAKGRITVQVSQTAPSP